MFLGKALLGGYRVAVTRKTRRTMVKKDLKEQQEILSWEQAADKFIDSLKIKGLAFHTRRWHIENLNALAKGFRSLLCSQHIFMNLVTEELVKQVVLMMVEANLSPTTINHRVRTLKQFYQFLVSESLVEKDLTVKLDRKKVKSTVIQAFTEEQLNALLKAPDKTRFVGLRDYTIMLLLLDTGIRLSELVSIKLSDLKLTDNELVIPHGKGDKYRRVFVSARTRETVKKYLKARGDISGNLYVFVNFENSPMCGRNVQERLKIYGKKAHLEGVRVSPHTFRHTFAKMYITRGGDPFSLQALLGHSTLDMVRHYVNLWGSDLQKMHRKFSPVDNLNRPIGGN